MKRAFLVLFSGLISSLLLASGCGYSAPASTTTGTTTTNPNLSKVANRALILNQSAGAVQIMDASKDTLNPANIPLSGLPQFMVLAPATKTTLVYHSSGNLLAFVDNTQETVLGSVTLPGFTESIVVSSDGKTAYAALPVLGQVVTVDIANKALGTAIFQIPGVRRLVRSHNGGTILVFNNGTGPFTIINTADNTQPMAPAGLDSPFSAVFSSDDTKAYILNCGPECGGHTAGVNVVNIGAGSAATLGSSVAVPGATIGIADGTNLYVAGTPNAGAGIIKGGVLSAINLSSLTVSSPVAISDGLHTTMALASNSKLYVGAITCTSVDPTTHVAVSGCLSVYNIASPGAILSGPLGDIAAIQPITGRNTVYVIEGGELEIYDTTTDMLQTTQIDIVGKAVDVKAVDQ